MVSNSDDARITHPDQRPSERGQDEKHEDKFLLIDGNSVLYRAFYAMPALNDAQGEPVGAIYGFATMLMKLLEDIVPSHVLVLFDAGKTVFRHEAYEAYKGTRDKMPSDLVLQFPRLKALLSAFGIKWYEQEGYEADDLIGTVSHLALEHHTHAAVRIISSDRDLLQLLRPGVMVGLTRRGVTELDWYDEHIFQETYGIVPSQWIEVKALMGDTSDNIPGVPGVGEKTALKLIQTYKTLAGVYEHLAELKGKLKENLTLHEDKARLSRELVIIDHAVPITMTLDEARYQGFYVETLMPFLESLAFRSLIDRIRGGALASYVLDQENVVRRHGNAPQPAHASSSNTAMTAAPITGERTDGLTYLNHIEKATDEASYIVLYYDGASPHHAQLIAGAIAHTVGTVVFNREGLIKHRALQQFFANPHLKKIVYDAKRALIAFARSHLTFKGYAGDGLIAQYLLDATRAPYTLSTLAASFGASLADDTDIFGKGSKFYVPEEDVLFAHAARSADVLKRLYPLMVDRLKTFGLLHLYETIEQPLVEVLARMELAGVTIDRQALEEIGQSFLTRMKEVEQEVYEQAGVQFNLNSPKQLAEVLFEKLMLPPQKKTKTGYSTDAETLEALAGTHPVIEPILTYRMLSKLYSTYVEGLIKEIHEDGKIHTTFHQALTSTGRLSSSEPNLQNIPMRQEEGRLLRKAFIPSEKHWRMVSADYSQIELRVLAHMSGDPRLIDAFLHDEDIHTQTAMDVFHVSREDVTPLMRRQAKAVNFGIIYGISDFGLAQNLKISRQEAKAFITRYFEVYPEVRRFLDHLIEEAREKGYVTTLFGRRRQLPEINDRNFARRSFAERTAMNTPIQGTAADIIKKAMVDIDRVLKEKAYPARMLLQVHDELVFEVDDGHTDALVALVREMMSQAVRLRVPLKVDIESGPTWYDAK